MDFIKQGFRNERFMLAIKEFAAVTDETVVDRIAKQAMVLRTRKALLCLA
ncbi:MAG TPA: hypothetical protein VHD56_13180 [Tepidisphaeraceae bacterium]|nr:hypothetical protein [Tepidisphaeraceae bacterium]